MMRRHHNENYFGAAIKISCGRVTRNKNITNSGLTKYHFYYNNNTKSSQPSLAHDFHSWNQWSCIFQFATILLTGFLRSEQQLFPCTRHSYTLSMATEKAPTTNEAALKNLEQQLTCPVSHTTFSLGHRHLSPALSVQLPCPLPCGSPDWNPLTPLIELPCVAGRPHSKSIKWVASSLDFLIREPPGARQSSD